MRASALATPRWLPSLTVLSRLCGWLGLYRTNLAWQERIFPFRQSLVEWFPSLCTVKQGYLLVLVAALIDIRIDWVQ